MFTNSHPSDSVARTTQQTRRIARAAKESQILKQKQLELATGRWKRWAGTYETDRETLWLAAAGSGTGEFNRHHTAYYRLATTHLMIERPDQPSRSRVIMLSDVVDASMATTPRGTATPTVDIILVIRESSRTPAGPTSLNPELIRLHDISDPEVFFQAVRPSSQPDADQDGAVVSLRKNA